MIAHGESDLLFLASKRIFQDATLSLEARGLLAYLMCLECEYFTLKQIAKINRLTRYKLSKLMRELVAAKIVERRRLSYFNWEYIVRCD